MANVLVEERSLQAIADAIRCKTGGNDTYKPREMAPAIRNLPGTGVLQNLSVTENGNYTPGAGVDGYDFVSVAVPGGFGAGDEGKVVQNGALMPQSSLSVTANGTYDTTAKNSVVVNISEGSTSILSGTTPPTANQGSDGNYYLCYTVYTPLEYAQSDGQQTIDTGVSLTSTSYYELKGSFTANDTDNNLYGAGWSYRESNIIATGGRIYIQEGGNYTSIPYDSTSHIFCATQDKLKIDSTVETTPNWGNVPSVTIRLFATSYNGSLGSDRISKGRIYYCKLYSDNTLIRDYVPVQRSDGLVGMYDLVNNVFYSSERGDLIAGPEKAGEFTGILAAYVKVNGAWQNLIGTDIDALL